MNIGEIARRAGVSRSTVSYALSGKRPISPETRARIQAVIDELDYQPSATARALSSGETRTVGLVFRRIAFVNRSERLFRDGYESAHRSLTGFADACAEHGVAGSAYLCGDDAASGVVNATSVIAPPSQHLECWIREVDRGHAAGSL